MNTVSRSGELDQAGERDAMRFLARALAAVIAQPTRLPVPVADGVHDLLVQLDAAGVAPPGPLDPFVDEPSPSLPLEAGSRAPVVGDEMVERCRPRWVWDGASPADVEAETTLVGLALVSQSAARAVFQSVPDGAWSDPSLGLIVRAAVEAGDSQSESGRSRVLRIVTDQRAVDVSDAEGCASRVTRIAETAGVPRTWLVCLLAGRCQLHDRHGDLAARVIAAARARSDIAGHVAAVEAHGLRVGVAPHEPTGAPAATSDVRGRLAVYARQADASPPTSTARVSACAGTPADEAR